VGDGIEAEAIYRIFEGQTPPAVSSLNPWLAMNCGWPGAGPGCLLDAHCRAGLYGGKRKLLRAGRSQREVEHSHRALDLGPPRYVLFVIRRLWRHQREFGYRLCGMMSW